MGMIRAISGVTQSHSVLWPWMVKIDVDDEVALASNLAHPCSIRAVKNFLREWTSKHCEGPRSIGETNLVYFDDEGDAILFWMTFK